jgi:hypothetical protein
MLISGPDIHLGISLRIVLTLVTGVDLSHSLGFTEHNQVNTEKPSNQMVMTGTDLMEEVNLMVGTSLTIEISLTTGISLTTEIGLEIVMIIEIEINLLRRQDMTDQLIETGMRIDQVRKGLEWRRLRTNC